MKLRFPTRQLFSSHAVRHFLVLTLTVSVDVHGQDPAKFVDPFIGTARGGNTFPGAVRPWGMVSVSPHNAPGAPSGYRSGGKTFAGFGHVHLSGTGCADLGSIILSASREPLRGNPVAPGCTMGAENATPGYYRVELVEPALLAEATAARRCGLTRFTSHREGSLNLFINAGESLALTGGGSVIINSPTDVEGSNVSGGFCGEANRQTVYFVARLSMSPDSCGTWVGTRLGNERRATASGTAMGAWFSFTVNDHQPLEVKVGISYVSTENARRNLDAEMPGWDFDAVRGEAGAEWNRQLSRVRAEGGREVDEVKFYTALYHMLIHPNVISDVNGEYPLMGRRGVGKNTDRERYTVFSLWDTYRTVHPFLTLLYPERQAAIISTMIDMQKESGWLPKWELAGNETYMMVGDPAVPVIADSYVKGLRDFDVGGGYEAMMKQSLATPDASTRAIRPGYDEYLRYGYIPFEQDTLKEWWVWGPVSTTLEYCLADWTMSQMAVGLGRGAEANELERRSQSYRNLFDPETRMVRPRRKDGSWLLPFDPVQTEGSGSWSGSGGPGFVEGNAWQYTWFIPHDIAGLTQLFGGPQAFVRGLNACFEEGHFTINNEPDIAYPYLFTYVHGEEHRTRRLVWEIMDRDFGTGPAGLPGNDDAGTISGWFVFSALGFYPACPGSGTYQIGVPLFPRAILNLKTADGSDREVVIERAGEPGVRPEISRVEFNGKVLRYSAIDHADLVQGGILRFISTAASR